MPTPPWERLAPECDFRDRLHELSRSGSKRLFHPLDAGTYVVSIQASEDHASVPRAPAPAEEVQAWELAIFSSDGRLLDETRDPEILGLPPEWRRFWRGGIARFVPSLVLRVLLDRFTLGPDYFDRFVLEGPEPD